MSSHLIILVICFGILAGALILNPEDSGTYSLRLGRISLPNICTFRSTTGLPCPGCGLTRSIVAATHGDLNGSLAYHRLGLFTLIYVFIQFVYRLGFFLIPGFWARMARYGKFLNRGIIILAILFGLNWILTLCIHLL